MQIGSLVRARRRALDLSQDALARRADVSLSLINQMERGIITDPHITTLVAVAGALDEPVSNLLEDYEGPKTEAPTSSTPAEVAGEERRTYPYPWMGDTLADTLARWREYAAAPTNPRYSHAVALACFDVLRSVLKYDVPGETLGDRVPENEVEERKKLADWLFEIARRAQDHYVDSNEAQAAEMKDLEERSENVVRLMRDTA